MGKLFDGRRRKKYTFGLDPSAVLLRVIDTDGVVEPVAEDGTEDGTNNGCEVKEAWDGWHGQLSKARARVRGVGTYQDYKE